MRRTARSLLAVVAIAFTACSDPGSGEPSAGVTAAGDAAATTTSTAAGPTTTAPEDAILDMALRCDPLDERACLLPWPNNAFTVPDPATVTGRRLDLHPESTPLNALGVPIDVSDQNRADGFSPGSAILTLVPGLDFGRSGFAPSTDIGASLAADAPAVLLDTSTGERLAYWAELDAAAPAGQQVLTIHPASSLAEGHRIVVGLRNLADSAGNVLQRTTAFQAALDSQPEPLERARAFRELIGALVADGVAADSLYLAWDFTVASAESLSGRVRHMRDVAYDTLGDAAPAFTILSQADDGGVRTVTGWYDVPHFLDGDGSPGNTMLLDEDGLPTLNDATPSYGSRFRCVLPVAPAQPVPAIVYGHGLLGNRMEVDALSFAAQLGVAGACATDQIGMSDDDLGNLATILADLSGFAQQADRMQQGLLNQQFLGRLLNHPAGFVSSPAFQAPDGSPLVAVGATQFVGNSQGGILGGAASAISTEWSRVVLGVPGINYSLLLPRSSDWPQFQTIFEAAYPDPVDRVLALQLIQLLWDRGENGGYAQHLVDDPYPGIEAKQVLLVQAFGDHQVANVSTEVLARTLGATARQPALAEGRSNDVEPLWGIAGSDPSSPISAVLVLWDFGTPAPPAVNLPPVEPQYGRDPHGAGSQEPRVLQQALTFLLSGELVDVCDGPCRSTVMDG